MLCGWFYDHLEGVRLQDRPHQPGFTCTRLLEYIWLAVRGSHFGPSLWAQCQGCDRLFIQGRADQLYHSSACRSAAGVRRSRTKEIK